MARVLINLKKFIDSASRIPIRRDNTTRIADGVKLSMNSFDEMAVETAIRLKTGKIVSEIVAVSCGPVESQETLRTALAMGVDRGIHVDVSGPPYELLKPFQVANIFAKLVQREDADLILFGKELNIDSDAVETAQITADLLNWKKDLYGLKIDKINGEFLLTRENSRSAIKVQFPAAVKTDVWYNERFYYALPNMMKTKTIEKITPKDLNVDMNRPVPTEDRDPIFRSLVC